MFIYYKYLQYRINNLFIITIKITAIVNILHTIDFYRYSLVNIRFIIIVIIFINICTNLISLVYVIL
jgi:hypothetical protein